MIYTLDLGKYSEAKVWVNEVPPFSYDRASLIETEVPLLAAVPSVSKTTVVAVEFHLSRNASNYALLGATFAPEPTYKVNATVEVGYDNVPPYVLHETAGEIRSGIPTEYAQAVIETVNSKVIVYPNFPSGGLNFNVGAHGSVGSSYRTFSLATQIILELIANDVSSLQQGDMEEMVLEVLRNS